MLGTHRGVDLDAEAVLREEAPRPGQQEIQVVHDERRTPQRVADQHGGVEAEGEPQPPGPGPGQMAAHQHETPARLERPADAREQAALIAAPDVADGAEADGDVLVLFLVVESI